MFLISTKTASDPPSFPDTLSEGTRHVLRAATNRLCGARPRPLGGCFVTVIRLKKTSCSQVRPTKRAVDSLPERFQSRLKGGVLLMDGRRDGGCRSTRIILSLRLHTRPNRNDDTILFHSTFAVSSSRLVVPAVAFPSPPDYICQRNYILRPRAHSKRFLPHRGRCDTTARSSEAEYHNTGLYYCEPSARHNVLDGPAQA